MLALVIFALDVRVPLGVAGGVPYLAVVALMLGSPRRSDILVAALGASALTLAGYALSPAEGVPTWVVLANRALALFAIWLTATVCWAWKQMPS